MSDSAWHIFVLNGYLSYRHLGEDKFDTAVSKVVAIFQGFTRTLTDAADGSHLSRN